MANRAYLRVWTRDFSQTTLIAQFARFLTTAPLSASENAFKELIVQPIDATELSLAEWDLKDLGYGAPEVAALAIQHLHPDSAYIVNAKWDIWTFDVESLKWMHKPEPLMLTCHGPEYDGGIAASEGHFYSGSGIRTLFSPDTAGCWRRARRRIPLNRPTIRCNTHSDNGCRSPAT